MSRVIANMSMSLDGFIADADDQIDQLFGWMGSGEVAVPTAVEWATFSVSPASAEYMRDALSRVGALIAGRHLFDMTGGWGGTHPMGVPVVVVTHQPPTDWPHDNFRFVGGVPEALEVARTLAGEKDVVVASAKIAAQVLDAGELDAIYVDLVPVLLGEGIRWFENLTSWPVRLGDPTVIEGTDVTHLAYDVLPAPEAAEQPDVVLQDLVERPTLATRKKIPTSELQRFQGEALGAVWSVLSSQKVEPAGAPYVRYHSFADDEADVELGIPTVTPPEGDGAVHAGVLPGGPAVTTRHLGAHDRLGDAYSRLESGVAAHERRPAGPAWEVYEWIDPTVAPDPTAWPPPAVWETVLVQPVS